MTILEVLRELVLARKKGYQFSFGLQIALRPEDDFLPSYRYCIRYDPPGTRTTLYPVEVVYWRVLGKKPKKTVGLAFAHRALGISPEDGSLLVAAGEEYAEEEPVRKGKLQMLRRDLLKATGLIEVPESKRAIPENRRELEAQLRKQERKK